MNRLTLLGKVGPRYSLKDFDEHWFLLSQTWNFHFAPNLSAETKKKDAESLSHDAAGELDQKRPFPIPY